MMVRWICGVSLRDRKPSEGLCNVQPSGYSQCGSVADVDVLGI